MEVINIHSRTYPVNRKEVWKNIEKLSTKLDPIWPYESWPRMILHPGLALGAKGGHGPIRYMVDDIKESEEIKFRFLGPRGFDGFHVLKLEGDDNMSTLTHEIRMNTSFYGSILWILAIKHLHDALIEDAFTKLEKTLNVQQTHVHWNFWVKVLRHFLK